MNCNITVPNLARAIHTVGKRKRSIVKAWVLPGTGLCIAKNQKMTASQYFCRKSLISDIERPYDVCNVREQYDVYFTAYGGGKSSQAGGLRLAISKALEQSNKSFRLMLKPHGLLTRDSRIVESKKPGRKKARKSFQFSKR